MESNQDELRLPNVHRILAETKQQVTISIDNDVEEPRGKKKKTRPRKGSVDGRLRAPKHVHGADWKDMIHITNSRKHGNSSITHPGALYRGRAYSSVKGNNWMEHKLKKRVCANFIPSQRYSNRCGCGMTEEQHPRDALGTRPPSLPPYLGPPGADDEATTDVDNITENSNKRPGRHAKWTIARNTVAKPTDSYGTIAFEGSSHQSRAQFVRTSFDTEPEALLHLLEKVWKLPPPKLVITIHGGLTNFDLTPKLARLFRKGILKAAKSTDAWIITSGLNAGVIQHVAAALEDLGSSRSQTRVLAIGISPWGMLKRRQRFEGKDVTVNYTTNQFNKSRLAELNDRHSYFIFADNGTVGRYGAEIVLRKRLETHLARKVADHKGGSSVPVVCVVLEGGAFTVKVVHDYVTTIPRIPVVICDGSGRAADLLSFAHHNISEDGQFSAAARNQLLFHVEKTFSYDKKNTDRMVQQIIDSAKNKNLLTVFRLGESQRQDLDHSILKALLKGKNLSPPEQLRLALAWNRADIARTEIFTKGTEWSTSSLHEAMMEALSHDRTDFVQLLLENGVSMHRFLTYGRLEQLYNTEHGPAHTLRELVGTSSRKHHLKLTEVGHVMENLIGHAYKSNYTKEDFKSAYYVFANRKQLNCRQELSVKHRLRSENLKEEEGEGETLGIERREGETLGIERREGETLGIERREGETLGIERLKTAGKSIRNMFHVNSHVKEVETAEEADENSTIDEPSIDFRFDYPYSELLIWAVLTKRQEMALLMWRHGEESLPKALVASRLYSALSDDASSNFLELELCEELTKNSEAFTQLSIEVLQYCSDHDVDCTLQLLTYELSNWGNETCLSLAALNSNRQFIAHPCCQLLLSDLWHGGLHIRNGSNMKILSCILAPPAIFLLEFKSKEELKLQPHTAAEHHEDNWESDSSISSQSDFSDTSSSDTEEDELEKGRPRAPTNEQPLSFQKLMRDRMPFRADLRPNGVPLQNGGQNGDITGKKRSRTISTTKPPRRKTKVSDSDDSDRGDAKPSIRNRRRSTIKNRSFASRKDEIFEHQTKVNDDLRDYKQSSLSWRRKLREFYSAPITTFWLWSVSFYVFLTAFVYTLLVETERNPSWVEWYVFFYVVIWSFEMIRKLTMIIIVDMKKPVIRKMTAFFFSYQNGILALAILTYLISFFIRLNPSTRALGRVMITTGSVFWCLKLVDYFSVHRQIGPYVTMAAEMIPAMMPILVMLFVALLSFGLVRQSITYPYEDWHWLLLRNIFYKPYFMLYGEVYAPEIDTCGDEVWDTHTDGGVPITSLNVTGATCVPGYFVVPVCWSIAQSRATCVPGYFVVPLFMTVFMIIANVLLMNTMVACCTYIFERNVENTQEIWLFERYRQVMEYESTPALPPPFTLIYHIYWAVKWLLVKDHFSDRRNLLDASLKLFLEEDEVERLHSFEEECVEEMEKAKDSRRQTSNDERIHRTNERTEIILNRMNNMSSYQNGMKKEVRELEQKMEVMETRHKEELECIRQMNLKLEQLLQLQLGTYTGDVGTLIPIQQPTTLLRSASSPAAPEAPPLITFDLLDSSEEERRRKQLPSTSVEFHSDAEEEADETEADELPQRYSGRRISRRSESMDYNDSPVPKIDSSTLLSEDSDHNGTE